MRTSKRAWHHPIARPEVHPVLPVAGPAVSQAQDTLSGPGSDVIFKKFHIVVQLGAPSPHCVCNAKVISRLALRVRALDVIWKAQCEPQVVPRAQSWPVVGHHAWPRG